MHLFRERVRARLEREVQMMKINESTKGPSIHDVRIGLISCGQKVALNAFCEGGGSKIPSILRTSFTDVPLACPHKEIGTCDALSVSGLADAAERLCAEWQPCWPKWNYGPGQDHQKEMRILVFEMNQSLVK